MMIKITLKTKSKSFTKRQKMKRLGSAAVNKDSCTKSKNKYRFC